MNTLAELLNFVTTALQSSPLCSAVRILETHQFSDSQFALKARAELTAGRTLQVRLYRNGSHTDYAYQLLHGNIPLVRWDNKEHFPDISSHPHHIHVATGQVEHSPLTGDPAHDLPYVLNLLTTFTE